MGRVKRVEITLGLSWLIAAGCGGAAMQAEMPQEEQQTGGTPAAKKVTMPTSSAGSNGFAGVMRAHARIEPIALAPAASTATAATSTASGAAGTAAAAVGAAAVGAAAAGAAASTAGSGGSTSASSAGKGGAGGTGRGAGYAAGSGGGAGASSTAGAAAGGTGGTSAATTSAAGTSAAGAVATAPSTGAAGTPAASAAGAGGAQAPASISGSANFASSSSGVNLTVMVSGCQDGKEYPIHVHQGASCESAMAQGAHWDMTRGEGIPNITCGGRAGTSMVSRPYTDAATAWAVGDGSATDVVGHVVVVHDADDPTQRIACGAVVKN